MACWRAAGAAPRLLRQAAARHYSRHPRLEDLPDARLLPLIALVGRPNVGKSALFNRLVRRRDALVLDTPGSHVTRDYREALAQLGDLRFRVADTPGLEPGAPPSSLQGRAAVLTASVLQGSRGVLLLLDATQGLVPADEELLSWLRRNSTAAPLLLAANKADTAAGRRNLEQLQVDLAGHGLGEALPISATSGDGLADLYQLLQPLVDEPHSSGQQQQQQQQQGGAHPAAFVTTVLRRHAAPATPDDGATDSAGADEDAAMDALLQSAVGAGNASASDDEAVTGSSSYLTAAAAAAAAASEGAEAGSDDARAAASSTSPSELVRLAIIGLPNAGKSSLLNALLGYERSLTGPEPGLTRDTTAGWLAHGGHDLQLLDTAGWKRATAALPTQAPHQQQQQQQQQQKQQRRVIEQPLGAELSRALADASLEAARRALSAAHVVLLLLDAPRLLAIDQVMSRLELQMAGLALQQGKALLLGLNKADALPGGQAAVEELRRRVADALDSRFLAAGRLPVLALSATKRQGLGALLDEVVAAYAKWNTSVSSFKLRASLAKHSLRFYGAGGSARLLGRVKWAAQLKARPPTFVLLLRGGQEVDDSGARFLAGLLRSSLGLQGVPLRLHLRYNKRKQAAGGGSSSGSSGRRSGHHKHRWRQR